jgi:putative flippase GtrA
MDNTSSAGHRTGTFVARFIVVGTVNTLVGLVVIYLCKWAFGLGDVPANLCGYAIGLAVSFVLNRQWTFRHRGAWVPALLRYLVVFLLAYLLNLATVLAAIHGLGLNSYVAQAVGIVPYTISFYLGSRFFSFSRATDATARNRI